MSGKCVTEKINFVYTLSVPLLLKFSQERVSNEGKFHKNVRQFHVELADSGTQEQDF